MTGPSRRLQNLMIQIIGTREEQVVGADADCGTVHFGPGKIPRRRLVCRTKIKGARVGADVRVKKLQEVHERHLRPALAGKWKSFDVVRRVKGHGDSSL